MWTSLILLGIALTSTTAITNFQFPSETPCIIFDTSLQISVIGVFKSGPEAKQIELDKKAVVMNSSYCDDGNSSSIDFFLEGGVGFTVQFLKLNDSVKMMPSISFVPGIIFNATSDTNNVILHSTEGKLLPPANVSYSCYTGDTPIVMTNGSSANISYHGIISLTQLRVQAFDIKNGDLSPGESCDITPVTSVAPPIKPVTPTPGNPPVQTYSVKSGNTDCIVLQAGIEFTIPYTSNGARLTKTIGVPNNTRVVGMCGGGVATTQSLSLMFYGDWIMNFIFSHALSDSSPRRPLLLDGTMYGIKEISLEYNISSYLFPDADAKDEKLLSKIVYKTPEYPTSVGTSYRCQPPTIVDVQGITTRMTSFQYLAFGNQTTSSFDPKTVTDCPAITPFATDDDDHTGTIVGVVIAVFFILMVLVGIYIYRRRGKVSYEQVY